MKKLPQILNGLLVVGLLSLTSCGGSAEAPATQSSNSNAKDAIENMMTRTSVREYTDQIVEDEKVEQILRAAMAAPTGGNRQPWAFVVINDKDVLAEISDMSPILGRTSLAIAVCGDVSKMPDTPTKEYWVQDCSAATENALLAAHALDLGAVWLGIYLQDAKVEKLSEVLGLPENIVPLNLISIGYPAKPAEIKDKWNPSNIHYNAWE